MAKKTVRVNIPRNPLELLKLASQIYAKHTADGNASALNQLEGKPWTTLGQNVASATTKHTEAEALKLQTEQAYRERDALMAGLEKAVKDSRDILLALNKANAKRLSEWGFDVDDTAQSTPTPTKP